MVDKVIKFTDMLIRIKNGQMARNESVNVSFSRLSFNVLDILSSEGYINGYSLKQKEGKSPDINVFLKYNNNEPLIKKVKCISTAGHPIYWSSTMLRKTQEKEPDTLFLISTNVGLMSGKKATLLNKGGLIICKID
jgi:small subunit ribosomal protein S8